MLQFVGQKMIIQGSSSFPISFPTNNTNNNIVVEDSLCDRHIREDDQKKKSGKWLLSKMRIMRNMMSPEETVTKKPRKSKQLLQEQQPQQQSTQANNSSNINNSPSDGMVRVCSDCNTTKTPLWRSGPSGPKVSASQYFLWLFFIQTSLVIFYPDRKEKKKKTKSNITLLISN